MSDKLHVLDRFWEKVNTVGLDTCWIWQSTLDKDGYGIFKLEHKDMKAHRLAWMFTKGDIPKGMQVLHRCDNPSCINPRHLFLGTPQDNMDDKKQKGRSIYFKGEQLPQAKLTAKKVLEIRDKYSKGGVSHNDLAKEYDVTDGNIYLIIKGKSWKHLESEQC